MLTYEPNKDFESSPDFVMRMYYEIYKQFTFVEEPDEREYKKDGKIEHGYGRPDIYAGVVFSFEGHKYKLLRDLGYWTYNEEDKANKTLTHIGEVENIDTNTKHIANIDTLYFKLLTIDEPGRQFK